jgi:HD-like signal output (HDOD) protein
MTRRKKRDSSDVDFTAKPQMIRNINELTTACSLPDILLRILDQVENEHSNRFTMARVIESDPDLAERVVKAANSPLYLTFNSRLDSDAAPITNLPVAVLKIGFTGIRNIVATQGLCQLAGEGLDISVKLMAHLVVVAEIARSFGNQISRAAGEDAYFAGLMHDYGKLVLLRTLRSDYLKIADFCRQRQVSVNLVESQVLAKRQPYLKDHVVVAKALLRAHRLPQSIVDAVAGHHDDPGEHIKGAGSWDLAGTVIAANKLAYHIGFTDGFYDPPEEELDNAALVELLGISALELDKISQAAVESARSMLDTARVPLGLKELRRISEMMDGDTLAQSRAEFGPTRTSDIYATTMTLIEALVTQQRLTMDDMRGITGLSSERLNDILDLLIRNSLVSISDRPGDLTIYSATEKLYRLGSSEALSVLAERDWFIPDPRRRSA